MQLTFYGHSGLAVQAVAVCQVEGGPAYHVHLRGEAAQVTYHLDRTTVDCGKQVGGGGHCSPPYSMMWRADTHMHARIHTYCVLRVSKGYV